MFNSVITYYEIIGLNRTYHIVLTLKCISVVTIINSKGLILIIIIIIQW